MKTKPAPTLHFTVRETYRLRPGQTIRMADGITADVLKVNECSALIREHVTKEVTVGDRTFIAKRGQLARISANSECEILGRGQVSESRCQAPAPPPEETTQHPNHQPNLL